MNEEKIKYVLEGIKKHPKIINESVRYDSAWGISKMCYVDAEEAQEMKDIYYALMEILKTL